MTTFEDMPAWLRPDHDELVARLRRLEWMEVQPQLRDRCWDDFNHRLGAREDSSPNTNKAERYACARRTETLAGLPVSGARMSISRAWAGRTRSAISLA
jgi:hypothetical protein